MPSLKKDIKQKFDIGTSFPLKNYTGIYNHPAFGSFKVVNDGDSLRCTHSNISFRLEHYNADIFQFKQGILNGTKIRFNLNIDGELESLSVPLEIGVKDINFKKVQGK